MVPPAKRSIARRTPGGAVGELDRDPVRGLRQPGEPAPVRDRPAGGLDKGAVQGRPGQADARPAGAPHGTEVRLGQQPAPRVAEALGPYRRAAEPVDVHPEPAQGPGGVAGQEQPGTAPVGPAGPLHGLHVQPGSAQRGRGGQPGDAGSGDQGCGHGRTSYTMLNGVSAARRNRVKPAAAAISRIRGSPAWLPSASAACSEMACGTQRKVEKP